MARSSRQLKLLEIINKIDIETQSDLANALIKEGFKVTQATVSRDIKELGLVKVLTPEKTYKYAQPHSSEGHTNAKMLNLFRESVLSIDEAGNIIVVKTLQGAAGSACSLIDKMNIKEIIGSVAGDDCVFLAVRNHGHVDAIVQQLTALLD